MKTRIGLIFLCLVVTVVLVKAQDDATEITEIVDTDVDVLKSDIAEIEDVKQDADEEQPDDDYDEPAPTEETSTSESEQPAEQAEDEIIEDPVESIKEAESVEEIMTNGETNTGDSPKPAPKSRSGNYQYDEFFGNLDTYNTDGAFNGGGDPNYNYDPMNRVAPSEPATHRNDGQGYTITPARLGELRRHFLYWFFDQGGSDNNGDYQKDIHASNPQVHKNYNFQLPFFGFRFNYTRLSMHGYLEFSDPPEHYTYPLTFPIKEWPRRNDPSFIGIFFSKCRIGKIYPTDFDQRIPGVYFRQERDLMTRTDRFGVEVRERVMWDIREGVVGADTFIPKHVVFVTWKNMSFAGGIDISLYKTNSFQMVLATDEVYTYAILNYITINWSSHTEAGGDTTGGEGGVPAYIGFNAGNGTQAYEYKPYSQASVLRDLTGRGWANGFPGRHIFRIDERIMLGTCNKDIDAAHLPLVFAPESGNMLGGTVVNITGPCFNPNERVLCKFDTESVIGHVIDRNRAICVQPFLFAQGYIRFEISIGTENFKWRGRYFVETPATATDKIFFENADVYQRAPAEIRISWNRFNLTSNLNAGITISLWGYRETTIRPQLEYIDNLDAGMTNTGVYVISPANYRNRDNNATRDMQFGFIMINLTNPEHFSGLRISPTLWSKPIPLGWYFGPQWERIHGRNWPRALCDNWLRTDRFLRNFAANIPLCPCTLEHAMYDKGRFMPDFECDRDYNPTCLHHKGAIHCVRTGQPNHQGSEQQCCYDRNGFLMMSYDQMWGSRPRRNHNIGQMPWNEANKVPTLSTWFNDVRPYYSCCYWQDEQAVGCETFRFERRPSQDCVSYQAPAVGAAFGDPHFMTFDNLQYTFNGMGEFVLVRVNDGKQRLDVQGRFEQVHRNVQAPAVGAAFGDPHFMTFDNLQYTFNGMGEFVLVRVNDGKQRLDVQGRFEQVHRNVHGPVMATQLTSIAARGNESTIIEVRVRPRHAQWRYRLDVFADGRRIYFDRPSLKFQSFFGVTVYTPTYILNQSEVVIMFSSGAGVEVVENAGHLTARVYLPWTFINKTRGLLGNWSWDMQDDLVLPDGRVVPVNLNNFESVHRDFAMHWMLSDREQVGVGAALFTREFGRLASHFANSSFAPNFIREPRDFLPPNRTHDIERATELCGESYQCRYDYGMSLDREMAHFTKNYYDSAVNIRETNMRRILSCGILETPRFGRKSNFFFVPGSSVAFECNEGFVLIGDPRRTCTSEGQWDPPVYGYTTCLREVFYSRRVAWISIGIIIAVILPIIMCVVCAVYCYRKKALKEDPTWKMSLPRSRLGSRSTLRHIGDDDDQDTLKKSRSYDKVYRTNEPLEGKPNNEFPEKKWDLDDEDVTSSDGSEFPSSKVASDIEYINRSDPQRQTGRRMQRMGTETIEEEQSLPPPPQDLASPTYSPTYSGLDRNSSFGQEQLSPPASQYSTRPPSGAVRVMPLSNNKFFGEGSMSPTSAGSPTPIISQEVGLPKANTKSTEV